jgi:tetratricopeptide (TPR) repeat protein
MEHARILRVVVASPSDVPTERDAVGLAAEEVDRNVGRNLGLRLEVSRWETDAHPGLHADGPQGLIDPILRIAHCDLLVGIFWKRFGTPTADGRTGAEHEFHTAYEAWKENRRPQIMLYFNQQPHPPTESEEEIEQWRLLLRFKKALPKEALSYNYNGCAEFEKQVRNHLADFVREFHQRNQPESQPAPSAPTLSALHSLPPPPADFTGREADLAELREAMENANGAHISGVQGQGGIGKTALALKLAEALSVGYPDAQIYLDLRGAGDKPMPSAEALAYVIRAFHPEARLPESEAELAGIYQSVLRGKRVLLLMDNARDAAQVRLLVPPAPGALLVTSRWHFRLPGLHAKDLSALPPKDAEALLLAIEPRIDGQAQAVAKLCGYLPQALRLAAGALAERRNLDPAEYARRLSDEKRRLKELTGSEESVEASIKLSYGLLSAEMQQRWRMLGVFPDTFDGPAAAALWVGALLAAPGQPPLTPAEDALGALLKYSMLEWNDTAKRYRLHDLMRDFARARLRETGEQDQAARRHATHYVSLLAQADDLFMKGGDSIKPGLDLFDLEWGNIQAGQAWAAAHAGQDDESARLCSRYPGYGAYCLDLRLHPRERIRWQEAALGAARRLKDRAAEGVHLGNLGNAYRSLGEYRRGIGYQEQALAIAQEIGDRRGEGQALGNLGLAYYNLGEYRRAIEYHEQHLAIAREIGERLGEGHALGNLGIAYFSLGEYRRAIEYHEKRLTIAREIGERRGEGHALGNLGNAYYSLGEYPRAIEYHEQRLQIAREIGDRQGEGAALGNLGLAYRSLGDYRRAIEYYEQHLKIAREIGDRQGEGNALGNLGIAYHSLGEYRRAIEYYQQQLTITREIGDRQGEAHALFNMSLALDKLSQRAKAIENAEAAARILEQIESPYAGRVRKQLEEWKGMG